MQNQVPKEQEVSQPKQEVVPEALEFKDKHKNWFNYDSTENAEMTKLAIAYEQFLAKENPNMPVKEVLVKIEDTLKKIYPHRFENQKQEQPAMVAKSTVSSTSKYPLENKLTESQKNLFKAAHRLDPSLKIEEYVKQLELTGRLKNDN